MFTPLLAESDGATEKILIFAVLIVITVISKIVEWLKKNKELNRPSEGFPSVPTTETRELGEYGSTPASKEKRSPSSESERPAYPISPRSLAQGSPATVQHPHAKTQKKTYTQIPIDRSTPTNTPSLPTNSWDAHVESERKKTENAEQKALQALAQSIEQQRIAQEKKLSAYTQVAAAQQYTDYTAPQNPLKNNIEQTALHSIHTELLQTRGPLPTATKTRRPLLTLNQQTIRQAIIMHEVLGKPKSLA